MYRLFQKKKEKKNNMDNVIVLYRFRIVASSFLKYRN